MLSFSKIQLIKNIFKKWRLFVQNRIHTRVLPKKKCIYFGPLFWKHHHWCLNQIQSFFKLFFLQGKITRLDGQFTKPVYNILQLLDMVVGETTIFSSTSRKSIVNWLVVWLPFFIFPYIGCLIIPIDFHIFQRASNHQPEHDLTWFD